MSLPPHNFFHDLDPTIVGSGFDLGQCDAFLKLLFDLNQQSHHILALPRSIARRAAR
jgi:hypothetical protein